MQIVIEEAVREFRPPEGYVVVRCDCDELNHCWRSGRPLVGSPIMCHILKKEKK